MRETVEVHVRGQILRDWTSVELVRTIDAASGSFDITSPARTPYPLAPGDAVEILAGGDLVLSGFVDIVERALGASSNTVRFRGRDKTADLVDSSAAEDPSELSDVDLATLLFEIADPFGIEIDFDPGSKVFAPFPKFARRPGDTAWALIERACRLRGVLVYSDGTGRLVVREAGVDRSDVELIEDENIVSATFTGDDSLRFSTYTVHGQHFGSNTSWGDLVAQVKGEATDAGARPGRRLEIIAESTVTNQTAQERAQWEAVVRAANAVRFRPVLTNWRKAEKPRGPLWTINELVVVRSPRLDLDRDLLVRGVTLNQSADKETCTLDMCRADAFQPQPDLAAEDDILSGWLKGTSEAEGDPDDVEPEGEFIE